MLVIGIVVLIVVVIVVAVVAAILRAYFGTEPFRMMEFTGFGWLFILIPLAFFIILIIAVALAVARGPEGAYYWHWDPMWHEHNRPHDALSVLNERYARGEISREDYQRMRDDIERGR